MDKRLERFKALVEPQLETLYRVARRLTGNRSDAEDLLQDACLSAWEKLPPDADAAHADRWLVRVLYHRFVDGTRRKRRSPRSLNGADDPTDTLAWRALEVSSAAQSSRRRLVRPVLLGLLMAGAAAAMLTLLTPDGGADVTLPGGARGPGPQVPSEIGVRPDETSPLAPFGGHADGQVADDRTVAIAPSGQRLVMLPTRYDYLDPEAVADIDATYAAFVRVLRERTELEIVELQPAQEASVPMRLSLKRVLGWLAFWDRSIDSERLRELGRHFGANHAVRFALGASRLGVERWGIRWEYLTLRANGTIGGVGGGGTGVPTLLEPSDPARRGAFLARSIYSRMVGDRTGSFYAALIANTDSTDEERLQALEDWVPLNEEAIAAAIELGVSSPAPDTRARVWKALGRTAHPAVAPPLAEALRNDSDATVRRAVAESSSNFLAYPGVRAAVEAAAIGDSAPLVRLQSRWMLMSDAERRAFAVAALHDRTLSADERIAPVMLLKRSVPEVGADLGLPENTRALIAEAGQGIDDPEV